MTKTFYDSADTLEDIMDEYTFYKSIEEARKANNIFDTPFKHIYKIIVIVEEVE